MPDAESVPVPNYDGPECHVCCDLMPNKPLSGDGHKLANGQIQVIIEALEAFEGELDECRSTGFISLRGRLGIPLEVILLKRFMGESFHVEIFTTGETRNCIGAATFIEPDITPQKAAHFARAKLDHCLASHPECGIATAPPLPTRVIHVGSEANPPRLITTTDPNTVLESNHYVALSYCWGRSQTLTTTLPTLPQRLTSIPWSSIPKTIQEAIQFTSHLTIPYIWIDALCIIQDSPSDWARESAKMKEVYSNALLTLSATSSPDTISGCFLPRLLESNHKLLENNDENHYYYARRPSTDTHAKLFGKFAGYLLGKYVAMTRGWVSQERLLSRRMVYSAFDELVWECRGETGCECGGVGKTMVQVGGERNAMGRYKLLHQFNGDNNEKLRLWMELVEGYSEMQFTRYSDRLVALAGIAERFGKSGGEGGLLGAYLAGNWAGGIYRQLGWKRLSDSGVKVERVEGGGPSWSWASVDQACRFGKWMDDEEVCSRVTLVGYEVELRIKENPFGSVERVRLRLEGPVVAVKFEMGGEGKERQKRVFVGFKGRRYPIQVDIPQWENIEGEGWDVLTDADEVVCLELYQTHTSTNQFGKGGVWKVDMDKPWSGHQKGEVWYQYRFPWLVLKKDPISDVYRRVGLLEFDYMMGFTATEHAAPGELIRAAEMSVVDIV